MMRIELRPDGPHDDDYTTEVARAVAEAVRVLSYATGPHADQGLTRPQTVYTVAGDLAVSASRLVQLFDQLRTFLDRQYQSGRLADDTGADPLIASERARQRLTDAVTAADALYEALGDVQQITSHLYTRPTPPGGRAE